MKCVEYTLKWLTLCAAWTFALAQDIPSNYPSQSDDDFDPQDFEEAQEYLAKYNYFHGPKPLSLNHPEDIREAIEEMQDFAGIPVTGEMDEETMAKIRAPRCGVADFVDLRFNAHLVKRRRRRYALAGQRWQKKSLTYRILNYTPDLGRTQVRDAVQKALQTWSNVTPLRFTEVTRGKADIEIKFAKGEHGDGYPFDGRGGTLAHAYFPGKGIGGDAHFDDHEFFSHNSYRGTNLFVVAAHELGHSLGLAHSSNSRALMAPYYQGFQPNFRLPSDDIKGIQRLYGRATTNPQPPTGPRPPTGPGKPVDPGACGVSFQAAMSLEGRIFLFQGSNYWRIEENGRLSRGYPKRITWYWKDAPSNIDAAMVMGSSENVVFFKGNIWYEYQGQRQVHKGTLTELGLPATVTRLDAAVLWEGNSMPYFFAGNDYYKFNEIRGRVEQGYPKPITPNWVNIPGNVDATFGSKGFTYFIKGQSYYKFHDTAIRRVLGPKDFGADFLQCTGSTRLLSDASQLKAQLVTVLLPLFLAVLSLLL